MSDWFDSKHINIKKYKKITLNKLSVNKLMKTQKKKYYSYTINEPDQLLNYINDNLTPKDKERKEKGEVFTPMWLVNEMLDKLPSEVWSNWDYKWLDPAVGIGNFPIAIYLRLMDGLEKREPDEEKRRKHIVEDMLFMIDISDKNIFVLNKIFCGNKYNLNINKGSFFGKNSDGSDDYKTSGKWQTKFKHNVFHVIVGNPPYNKGGTGRTSGSRQPFWPKFIDLSINILEENGYILFITPTGWRKPYNVSNSLNIGRLLLKFVKEGSLYYLNMDDRNIPNFPPVDYYIYNKRKYLSTIIDSSFNDIVSKKYIVNLNPLVNEDTTNFIPSLYNSKISSIFDKIFKRYNKNNNYSLMYDGTLDVNKKMEDNPKIGIPFAFYYKNGEYVKVYNDIMNHKVKEYFTKPKIVCTFNGSNPIGYLYPIFYKKPIATTTFTMYQLIDDKDIKYVSRQLNFLKSKLLIAILKITQYSPAPRNKNDHKIINLIQIQDFPNNPTEKDIYDYYGITKEEQLLIEAIVKEPPTISKRTKKVNSNTNNGSNLSRKNNVSLGVTKSSTKPTQEPLVEEPYDWSEDGCGSGKVRNPDTKRCVKKCKSNYKRKRIKPYNCLNKTNSKKKTKNHSKGNNANFSKKFI